MHARLRLAVASVLVALLVGAPAQARVNPQNAGLQVALRSWGHYFGPVDGIAGPMTQRAVRDFQRRKGLVVDGIAGPRTRRALGRLGRPLYGKRVLRRRMVGWDVSVLQFLLTRRGAPTGIIDGYFGAETVRALRRFQRRARIGVDGIAGPRTRRALGGTPTGRPSRPSSVRGLINHWAGNYGMNPALVRALAWIESGFQTRVVSPAGAFGVMQVTPATWDFVEDVLVGRRIPRTVSGNVHVGVAYFHWLLHEFDGNVRRALAAYNQGPRSVRRNGVFRETRRFVADVLASVGRV
jgi:Transglycosylase SLT domain/Putative peptidoglycan binding domain